MESRRRSRFDLVHTVLRGNRAQDDRHGAGAVKIALSEPPPWNLLSPWPTSPRITDIDLAQIKITVSANLDVET